MADLIDSSDCTETDKKEVTNFSESQSLPSDCASHSKEAISGEEITYKMSADVQSALLTQYGLAAEQIRHQDSLAWQTFSFTLAINGIGIVALATIGAKSIESPITLLVAVLGLASCLFGMLHVFRAIRYQEHVYGVAKEIEQLLSGSVKLFNFSPNIPQSYSPMSKFYNKKIHSIAKISARKVWASGLAGVAIGWLTISVVVMLNLSPDIISMF